MSEMNSKYDAAAEGDGPQLSLANPNGAAPDGPARAAAHEAD